MGVLAGTGCVQAQQHNNADMTERMQQMQAKRAERLADELKLQGEARVTFMATYGQFQAELLKLMVAEREAEMQATKKKIDDLTDAEAEERVKSLFDRKTQQIVNAYNRLAIEKKYYDEFAKTMTNKQLLKIVEQDAMRRSGRVPSQQGQNRRGGNRNFGGQQGNFGGSQDNFGADFGD